MTKNKRCKVAGYQTLSDEMLEDLDSTVETIKRRVVNMVRKEAKKQHVKLLTPMRIDVGRINDDLIRSQCTVLASAYGFPQPSFIHRDYSRTRNRKRRERK